VHARNGGGLLEAHRLRQQGDSGGDAGAQVLSGNREKGGAGRWSASSRGHGGRRPRPGVQAGERAATG
jgi:hypothetical protein